MLLAGIVRALLALLVAVAAVAIFTQVVFRFVLATPLAWPEELAVLVFAWITFLGAAYVQADDSHLAIDAVRRALRPPLQRRLDQFRLAVIGGCSLVLIWQGTALALRTLPLTYPAMGVSRALLYVSVPVCFAIGLVFVLRHVIGRPAAAA